MSISGAPSQAFISVDNATKRMFRARKGVHSGFELFENGNLLDKAFVSPTYTAAGAAVRTGHPIIVEAPSVFPLTSNRSFWGRSCLLRMGCAKKSYGRHDCRRRESHLPSQSRDRVSTSKDVIIPRKITTIYRIRQAHAVHSRKILDSIAMRYETKVVNPPQLFLGRRVAFAWCPDHNAINDNVYDGKRVLDMTPANGINQNTSAYDWYLSK